MSENENNVILGECPVCGDVPELCFDDEMKSWYISCIGQISGNDIKRYYNHEISFDGPIKEDVIDAWNEMCDKS